MSNKRLKRRRLTLFKKWPYCHWCARKLIITKQAGGRLPENFATIDHLRSRLDPNRRARLARPQEERTVLACPACNNQRSKEENAKLPIEEQHERSQRHPSKLRLLALLIVLALAWGCARCPYSPTKFTDQPPFCWVDGDRGRVDHYPTK